MNVKADENDEVVDSKEKKTQKNKRLKKKKVFWATTIIAEEQGREALLDSTFNACILHLIFLLCVTTYATGIKDVNVYYLTRSLTQEFAERSFETYNGQTITFSEIGAVRDFWGFIDNHFIRKIYWEYYHNQKQLDASNENKMNILGENKMLGVPRIRQVKMSNDSCIIHEYFRRLFLTCFAIYYESREDKKPFGLKEGTAWTYSDKSKTKSLSYSGSVATYGGGGYYTDFGTTHTETIKIINTLEENLWVTKGTRAILIDFFVYNANVNLFAACKMLFAFPTTGGILPSLDIHSVRMTRFITTYDYIFLGCEIGFYVFVLYYASEEIREVFYFKGKYFLMFWSYIDTTMIILSIICAALSVVLILETSPSINLVKSNPTKYGNLEHLTYLHLLHNDILAVDLFLIYIKIFKFLNFNKRMGQLNSTLRKCAWDILGFSLMFFIVFFAYSELGYLLFGNSVENFSSFGTAMFTLLRTILGDFDYSELSAGNKILAPIFFISYMFLVFFVLLNMFLAIINDTYADVKTEIAIAPDELQMTEFLINKINRCLRKFRCSKKTEDSEEKQKDEINVTIRQITQALKKCGFSDADIESFFASYDIDPQSDVKIKDTNKLKEELDVILGDVAKTQNFVKLDDFIKQQEKLADIEKTIAGLTNQIKELLSKLEKMENVQKVRRKQD